MEIEPGYYIMKVIKRLEELIVKAVVVSGPHTLSEARKVKQEGQNIVNWNGGDGYIVE